jgi:hypothetical protein
MAQFDEAVGPDLKIGATCEKTFWQCVLDIASRCVAVAAYALGVLPIGVGGRALRRATSPKAIHNAHVDHIADFIRQRGFTVVTGKVKREVDKDILLERQGIKIIYVFDELPNMAC